MTDPEYLDALASEHNAAGAVLLRRGHDSIGVLVRVFTEGGAFRFVIEAEHRDPAGQQLMISKADLARLLESAQPIE